MVPVRMSQALIDRIDKFAGRVKISNRRGDPSRAGFVRQAVLEKIGRMERGKDEDGEQKDYCARCYDRLESGILFFTYKKIRGKQMRVCPNCSAKA